MEFGLLNIAHPQIMIVVDWSNMDVFGVAILLQLTFAPIVGDLKSDYNKGGLEMDTSQRTVKAEIVGMYYKSIQQCIDARELLAKTSDNPNMKWGCIEAIHPVDEKRLMEERRKHREEGSHNHNNNFNRGRHGA